MALHASKQMRATNQYAYNWTCAQVDRRRRLAPSLDTPCMLRRHGTMSQTLLWQQGLCVSKIAHAP